MSKETNVRMADHILTGGIEERQSIRAAKIALSTVRMNRSVMRKFMQTHIFYIAYRAKHGFIEADKKITQMMYEVYKCE